MRIRTLSLSGATAVVATALVATALTGTAAAAAATSITYQVTDIGSLGVATRATAINAAGQVTGRSTLTVGGSRAFLWSNGTMTELGTLGGELNMGRAINGSGDVFGTATDPGQIAHSTLWKGTTVTALSLGGGLGGINDSGQISHRCSIFVCELSNGTRTVLPIPSGFIECSPAAINNNGQVLGNCEVTNDVNDEHGVVWTNGIPTVLPTLGGTTASSGTVLPLATAINNNGQVTGTAVTRAGALDGFLWSNGKITDLGPAFAPAAINNNGVIVGGQLIDIGGTLQNLNNLIPAGSPYQIQSATGINDNGQIIANANNTTTNQQHALLLTPN